ncbi:MAG: metabolite traffic protein EboE [Planctomycetes bacterium]|nr:metabolite traffic protein EboE [Planctomycetota bacterium]
MPQIDNFCLSYCTNVHPSEKLEEMRRSLETYTLPLKRKLFPGQPMGLGVWMAARSAQALQDSPAEFESFRQFLHENGFFLFTINAFPYGDFHSRRVKEQVYLPDWTQPERVAYTCRVADLLGQLLPDGLTGSISTLSGAFRPHRHGDETFHAIARNLARAAAHLRGIEHRTGRILQIGIEPEPWSTLEHTSEARTFFKDYIYRTGRETLARGEGMSPAEAEVVLRRHLGLCFDCCHQAVEFEDLPRSLADLAADGIPVAKVHLSCALAVSRPGDNPEGVAALLSFDEERYLHQLVARTASGRLETLRDLDALKGATLEAWRAQPEWRCHFHVPIFLERLPCLQTTQESLRQALEFVRRHASCRHLEIETYTWQVIPPELRETLCGGSLVGSLEQEFQWVLPWIRKPRNSP